jgi:PTH1 family peptidyl-tRNA hydrolase
MSSTFILCGLGNPGEKYLATRHNLGFRLADSISEKYGGRWSHSLVDFLSSAVRVEGKEVLLVKPQTYMNLSGRALDVLGEERPVSTRRLLVVCDDTALPTGQIRLRRGGSDGGHNGLKSIIDHLNTEKFPRLRLGCGPVPEGTDPADYVLAPFPEDEVRVIGKMMRSATKCVETWLRDGIDTAMNRFNARNASGTGERPDHRQE